MLLFFQVEFLPTLRKLESIVNTTARDLTTCLAIFDRLPDKLTSVRSKREVTISFQYLSIFLCCQLMFSLLVVPSVTIPSGRMPTNGGYMFTKISSWASTNSFCHLSLDPTLLSCIDHANQCFVINLLTLKTSK